MIAHPGSSCPVPIDARRGRILVAEDNEANRLAVREALELHFELDFARSGEECLSLASETRPDVILLDLVLGDLDGYETCRRLRADLSLACTKIVIVSGRATDGERVRGYAAGADDFLIKPYREEELLAKSFSYVRYRMLEAAVARLTGERTAVVESLRSIVTEDEELLASLGDERLPDDADALERGLARQVDRIQTTLTALVAATTAIPSTPSRPRRFE